MRKSLILVSLLALYALSGLAHAGKVYKWVDKDGNVHYTNMPPPEAAQRDRTVLDERGNVTETLEGARTPEEIEAERQRKTEVARQEKLAEERAARDNMLLQTYTNVGDMEMARDGRINALEAQVKVVSGAISSLETQIAGLESRAATVREAGKPVPEALQKEIDDTRAELLNNQKFLIARREEQDQLRERFAGDIARFKELKGLK